MAGAWACSWAALNYYDGEPLEKPTIGDAIVPLSPRHIPRANALMFLTTGLFLAVCLALRGRHAFAFGTCWRAAG